jgi:hypothetical protein
LIYAQVRGICCLSAGVCDAVGAVFAHLGLGCFLFLGVGVPFAGWDVVLSADPDLPVCLLEVNLSCNFFRGSFDKKLYLDFIDDAFAILQSKRLVADRK